MSWGNVSGERHARRDSPYRFGKVIALLNDVLVGAGVGVVVCSPGGSDGVGVGEGDDKESSWDL